MRWKARKNGEPRTCVIAGRAVGAGLLGEQFDRSGRGRYGFQVFEDGWLFERVLRVSTSG